MPSHQELKKEFERCKLDLNLYHSLHEKRELKQKKIQHLKESVESKLIQMHRLSAKNPAESESLKKEIDTEMEQIAALKTSALNIDHEIDLLGDEREETCAQLKQQLIATLQKEIPEAAEEYRDLERELNSGMQKRDFLVEQRSLALPFFAELKEGAGIDLKKWGFFEILLGRNSKAHLARIIQKASTIAENIIHEIQDERLLSFLNHFLKETSNSWNKELYQGKFQELYVRFSQIMVDLNQEIDHLQQRLLTCDEKIENWIEKYCR